MKPAAIVLSCVLLCTAILAAGEPDERVETTAAPKQFSLVIRDREIAGGEKTVRVVQGDLVELIFATDEAASLHLHGYDIEFDVSPRDQVRITFEAHATGRFPVTSHGFAGEHDHGHRALLYVEVYPD